MKARIIREWGGRRRARYVTPDLSYYWEGAREQCEHNKRDEKKKVSGACPVTMDLTTRVNFRTTTTGSIERATPTVYVYSSHSYKTPVGWSLLLPTCPVFFFCSYRFRYCYYVLRSCPVATSNSSYLVLRIQERSYTTTACAAGVVTKTTDKDGSRYTYNGTRRVRQLALGCESN